MVVVTQSLVMAIYQGCLLWDHMSLPSNFSIFYCGEPSVHSSEQHSRTLLYNLKIEEGRGLIEDDFREAMKYSYCFPKSAYELQTQIQNFAGLLSALFGQESYVAQQVTSWDCHIQQFLMSYKLGAENSRNFFTQVLYGIDISVQNFLRSCNNAQIRPDVTDSFLDFQRDQKDIINRQFFIRMPHLEPSPKDRQQLSTQGNAPKRQKTAEQDQPAKDEINTNLIAECKIKPEEAFYKVFLKSKIPPPTQDGRQICLNYNIRGACHKNCKRSHEKLSVTSKKELMEFCTKARAANV